MRLWISLIAAIALCLGLAGCQSKKAPADRWTLETASVSLIRMQSNKEQVLRRFGPPGAILYTSEMSRPFSSPASLIRPPIDAVEIWTYQHEEKTNRFFMNPDPVEHHRFVLTLYFDREGTLLDYVARESVR